MNSVYARSEVLTAVMMKTQVFRKVKPGRGVNSYRRFGEAQCLNFRRQTVQTDTPISLFGLLTLKVGKLRAPRNVVRVHQPTQRNIPEIGTLGAVIISLNITNLLAFIMDKIWNGNYCSRLYKLTYPTNQEQRRIDLHLRVT
jgi:hypothetical protein